MAISANTAPMNNERKIVLRLTQDEALVLFEYLAALEDQKEKLTEVSAEDRVLWQLEGQLEEILVEPFHPDYVRLVEAARRRVCDCER